MRKLSQKTLLLILFSLSFGGVTAQVKDSDKVTVTVGELRRSLEREDRLKSAFGELQKESILCDSTLTATKIQLKKKTNGKRFWQSAGIAAIVYAIIKSL